MYPDTEPSVTGVEVKRPALLLSLILLLLAFAPVPTVAEGDEPVADGVAVSERVHRARRLREFGYPLLAREQLDIAVRHAPENQAVLLEYVRLFTRSNAEAQEVAPYVSALLQHYPHEYEPCFEVALWLFTNERSPEAPQVDDPERVQLALERLSREMHVYTELAEFIRKPEGDLPESAAGRPALPLAYLARCAAARPGCLDVAEFAAQYLDIVGRRFHEWSTLSSELEPFGKAALALYEHALPLYRHVQPHERFTANVRVRVTNLLYRMGRYEDSRREAISAELLVPDSLLVATTLFNIAEATSDIELLIDSLERQDRIYADESSRLDLSAARRIKSEGWEFRRWFAYKDVQQLRPREQALYLRQMLERMPDFVELHYLLARQRMETAMGARTVEQRTSMLQGVLEALESARPLSNLADWHGLLGACMWELGEFKAAAAAYDNVAELDPNDREATRRARAARDIHDGKYSSRDYLIYRQSIEPGMLPQKRTAMLEVSGRAPKFFDAHILLGKLGALLNDLETSYTGFSRALELRPTDAESLEGAAEAAMHLGNHRRAVELYEALFEEEPHNRSADYWAGLNRWALSGTQDDRRALQLWLQATGQSLTPTERRERLENAARLAPRLAEPLIELAALERGRGEFGAAESLLERASEHLRDNYIRATLLRERGRLHMAGRRIERAVSHFEQAYSANPDDGTDLLLAALALQQAGESELATAAMRRLFQEHTDTTLLRPRAHEIYELNLAPADVSGMRRVSPDYSTGDRLTFRIHIEVEGEGKGQPETALDVSYDINVTVHATPNHGGLWRLGVRFSNTESAEWKALEELETELRISPWFGLIEQPMLGGFDDIAGPAVQALVEALTCGLGDSPLPTPHVWQNKLTRGPPRFGGDAVEGSMLAEVLGDNKVVVRRAAAGREVGRQADADATYGRSLEARVELGGARRAIRRVQYEIRKEELTQQRDDVIKSRLRVTATAR
jgi:tetratricopeptide (TPR) repeat protein